MNYVHLITIFGLSACLSMVLTGLEIPMLQRLKAGQSIREEGPQAHLAKAGTPTMGGIAMLISLAVASLLAFFAFGAGSEMLVILLVTLAYGLIGFRDDYIKIMQRHNEGLTPRQKIVLQIGAALVFSIYEYFCNPAARAIVLPFYGGIDLGWLTIPFLVFVMVAMTNAVNLTDGLDGLASSVTAVVALFFTVICAIWFGGVKLKAGIYAPSHDSAYFAAAIMGVCIGFLKYNHHPARVFMGDTGSLALGAGLAALAISCGAEFFLPIAGGIYVAEALSVIIQVFVFKTQNGRRFFRMAPLHHHYELGGWSEVKIVTVFSIVTAALCFIALMGIRGR
jgi:phospho-N-acetylmuramoyl-pentapeptide-transferase